MDDYKIQLESAYSDVIRQIRNVFPHIIDPRRLAFDENNLLVFAGEFTKPTLKAAIRRYGRIDSPSTFVVTVPPDEFYRLTLAFEAKPLSHNVAYAVMNPDDRDVVFIVAYNPSYREIIDRIIIRLCYKDELPQVPTVKFIPISSEWQPTPSAN